MSVCLILKNISSMAIPASREAYCLYNYLHPYYIQMDLQKAVGIESTNTYVIVYIRSDEWVLKKKTNIIFLC